MIGVNANVDLPIRLKGNLKRIVSGNSLCVGDPKQRYRRCFADVTNRGSITTDNWLIYAQWQHVSELP